MPTSSHTKIDKYILLEKIAAGGMAEVWLASASTVGGVTKFVAIKKILPHLMKDEAFIQMFKDEAAVAMNLSHSNIVSITGYYQSDTTNELYLVMDYVAGRNLRQILEKMKKTSHKLTTSQIIYIIKELAAGLDHAHRSINNATGKPLNIIHRDISPQNCMVSFDGEVKIVDFGIAKAESQKEQTEVGTLKGKFGYMSPEQAEGAGIDLRTDIFSLGIVMWELLANRRLFVGKDEMSTLKLIRNAVVPHFTDVELEVDGEIERIVRKALSKNPETRYATAAVMHRDLNKFLNIYDPDFTAQDFAMSVKTLFADEILERRTKLIEYSKMVTGITSQHPSDERIQAEEKGESTQIFTFNQEGGATPSAETVLTKIQVRNESPVDAHIVPDDNGEDNFSIVGRLMQNSDPRPADMGKYSANPNGGMRELFPTLENSRTGVSNVTMQSTVTENAKGKGFPKDEKLSDARASQENMAPENKSNELLAKVKSAPSKIQDGVSSPTLSDSSMPPNAAAPQKPAAAILSPKPHQAKAISPSPHQLRQQQQQQGQNSTPPQAAANSVFKIFAALLFAGVLFGGFKMWKGESSQITPQIAARPKSKIPAFLFEKDAESSAVAPKGPMQRLAFQSMPSGAEIWIDSGDGFKNSGNFTPSGVYVPADKTFSLKLRKLTYEDFVASNLKVQNVGTKFEATLVHQKLAYVDIVTKRAARDFKLFVNDMEMDDVSFPLARLEVPAMSDVKIRIESSQLNLKLEKSIQLPEGERGIVEF